MELTLVSWSSDLVLAVLVGSLKLPAGLRPLTLWSLSLRGRRVRGGGIGFFRPPPPPLDDDRSASLSSRPASGLFGLRLHVARNKHGKQVANNVHVEDSIKRVRASSTTATKAKKKKKKKKKKRKSPERRLQVDRARVDARVADAARQARQ